MKEFLSREGQTYEAKNIEEDDSAYDELMALGARAVPVTVVNGVVIIGFNERALRDALAAARP